MEDEKDDSWFVLFAVPLLDSMGAAKRATKAIRYIIRETGTTGFEDNFRHAWSEKWHLDGENAKIIQKDGRLEMYAGGRAYVDADHLVLWTKEEFKGT